MFGFLVKKTFFDMWDNMFRIVFLNLGYLAVFSFLVYVPSVVGQVPLLRFAAILSGMVLLSLFTGGAAGVARRIADYESPGFKEFYASLKEHVRPSLWYALINSVYFFLLSVAFPVYAGIGSIVGLIAMSVLFWVTVVWLLASQYFFAVTVQLGGSFRQILRKTMLLTFDNTIFSISLIIGALIIVAGSAFTAFLLPGIGTLVLWTQVALKLRLLKYDYLEKPDAERKNIPWDALLVEDRERVGKRTLRGMIFPWKE